MTMNDPQDATKQIKRRRGRKSNKPVDESKMYFNSGTQEAIVMYQNSDVKKDRDRLYVTRILPAFEKLVENLINIHKFSALHDSYDDLKNDCVNFLFETIHKFDPTRGTAAFSYFNVVAKHWLIIKTKHKVTRSHRGVSMDDPDALNAHEMQIVEDHCMIPGQDVQLEKHHAAQGVIELLYEMRDQSRTENELACMNAIIAIFENINEIDLMGKSALLLYIRELSNLSPKQMTTTLTAIRNQYRRLKGDPKFKLF